ncbi:hypothetical protein [Hyphomicrobium sp.]|uniref:hypothetical protein n=1 Tax=Hyphomicrobium sp. TaxID=82 RepID=UPI003F70FAB2
MILDDERLARVRDNAAFAIRGFSEASGAAIALDRDSVAWVDGFIERMRARYGDESAPGGLVSVIGSFLGEAIIARAGGDWVSDEAGGVGVAFACGDTAYPFGKVEKQFEQGSAAGESILSFYDVCVDLVATGKLAELTRSSGEAA